MSWQDVFDPFGNYLWKNTVIGQDPGADAEAKRKALLNQQSAAAGGFADQQQNAFAQNQAAGQANIAALQATANGQNSVSAEQLRQAMLRNQAAQQSMAAGAAPQDAAGAARTAAIQMGRQNSGLAGQQAIAGLQERNQAQQNLTGAIQGYGGQALQATQGGRGQAITGYGAGNAGVPEKSGIDQYGGAIVGGLGMIAKSDRRAKTDVKDGDGDANKMLESLRAWKYRYKDEDKDGKGARVGIMAQDLERAGLKHAVINTPGGKVVHGAHLATANTAMLAALQRRLAKLEEN